MTLSISPYHGHQPLAAQGVELMKSGLPANGLVAVGSRLYTSTDATTPVRDLVSRLRCLISTAWRAGAAPFREPGASNAWVHCAGYARRHW
jgi:hypothetical protein